MDKYPHFTYARVGYCTFPSTVGSHPVNELYFKRLMGHVDPKKPSKELLRTELIRAVRNLDIGMLGLYTLNTAFEFSYEGHRNAPLRDSGEAYIFHPFRATVRMAAEQERLGVLNVPLLAITLLHDCVEDAEKGGYHQFLLQSQVFLFLGPHIAQYVYHLTKHKEKNETGDAYFTRIERCDSWQVIAAKFEDRIDNMLTIGSVGPERREKKIRETERWFPSLEQRMSQLIDREIGQLGISPLWSRLPSLLAQRLNRIVMQKKKKYGMT